MSEVFVSSSCVNNTRIADSVRQLVDLGFRKIELSGGTNLYSGWKADLAALQTQFNLSYQCHNYFPPPKEHFALNLSAPEEEVRQRSIDHVIQALRLSSDFQASRYAVHAGFRLQPKASSLGKALSAENLISEQHALELFTRSWEVVQPIAQEAGVTLFVENNVLSAANCKTFGEQNPFLATDAQSIKTLQSLTDAPLLLDVAHLKVSCASLGLSFAEQINLLLPEVEYVHISDNDAKADTNQGLEKNSELHRFLSAHNLKDKSLTLEVYDGSLVQSAALIDALMVGDE